ncbi:hypothetical protein BHE74_00052264, partial [Ensete ventricosum]
ATKHQRKVNSINLLPRSTIPNGTAHTSPPANRYVDYLLSTVSLIGVVSAPISIAVTRYQAVSTKGEGRRRRKERTWTSSVALLRHPDPSPPFLSTCQTHVASASSATSPHPHGRRSLGDVVEASQPHGEKKRGDTGEKVQKSGVRITKLD